MRMAVGALLGLVLGTAVVAAIGLAFNSYAYAGGLAAGILSGLLMRTLTGPGGAIYAKGALAAMATAAAAILGPFVQTQWFHSQFDNIRASSPEGAVNQEASTDEAEADATIDEQDGANPEDTRGLNNGIVTAPLRAPDRDPFATADVACLVIGCLAAYQLGKGPMPLLLSDDGEDNAPHNRPSNLPPVD